MSYSIEKIEKTRELFLREQLPVGNVMMVIKGVDGAELACLLRFDASDNEIVNAFRGLAACQVEYDNRDASAKS